MFTKEDIERELSKVREGDGSSLHIVLAPNKTKTLLEGIPQIQIDQLHSIVSTLHEIKHGILLSDDNDMADDKIFMAINSFMTATIGQKSVLTYSKLKKVD